MQKWEYQIGFFEQKFIGSNKYIALGQKFNSAVDMLNYFGERGWQLTSVSTFLQGGTTLNEYFYFKRPKE